MISKLPRGPFTFKGSNLYFGGHSVIGLAARYGTPAYVYDLQSMRTRALELRENFPGLIRYAAKCNSNIGVLKLFSKMGFGLDVVSGGELRSGLAAGFKPGGIVFSGVGKTVDEIDLAIIKNVGSLNIESLEELQRIVTRARFYKRSANVSFRINPNVDPKTHRHITTGRSENKFGLSHQELKASMELAIRQKNLLCVKGLSYHLGSQIQTVEPFFDGLRRAKKVLQQMAVGGLRPTHLSVGGGFGISYLGGKEFPMKEFGRRIREEFNGLPLEPMCEPGRWLVAHSGILIAKVEYTKSGAKKKFAILNTGMHHLLRPALYEAHHEIIEAKLRPQRKIFDVVGPICESTDVLGRNRRLSIHSGDIVVVADVGAYGFVMASCYNSHPLPTEVLLDGRGQVALAGR